jgi:parallel beta-helix repeat protein
MNCGGCGVTCSPSWTCVGGTCTAPPCNAECGNTINSSIVLNCSLSCGGTALKIGADSITLNCGGHAIGYAQTSTGYGINITNHNSVTIENCNITQTNAGISGAHAIYMSNADSSIIEYTNISVNSSGGYGISLSSGSGNNTITNNRIIDMNSYGIRVSSSSGNLLFNNLINATTPADADASLNYWNSTLTAGTNIIGGPYNGGNFYASLDGYGFSETCSANSTRICTSSYDMLGDVGGNNVDYLPLAVVVPPELLIINSSLNITAPYGSNYTTDLAGAINLTNFTGGAIVAFPAGTNGSVTVNVTTDLSGGSLVTVSGAVLPAGTNKTIFVPKLLGMDQICVNDNDSIVSISEGCNQSGEIFIGCPGSNGSISCAVGSDSYAVSGLNHSCVGEIYIPTITNSTPFTSATLVKDDNSTYPLASWSNSSYINVTLTCNDWAGSGCNFTQSSPDLASWADGGLVYTAPSGSAYYPSALYDSNGFGLASPLYKIWYSDGSNNAFVINSTDGINWNSNQTLSGLSTPHHVQVLYDINCFGASPCNSSTAKYRIWYWNSTYVTVYDIKSIATAESADGISWSNDTALSQSNSTPLVNTTNLGPNNWNQGTYGPASLFYNSTASNSGSSPWSYSYVMYYDATDGGREFLGLAYSSDGLNWTANSQSPTLNISSGSAWDNVSVSYCSVYRDENGYHMWYSGSEVSGANHGIGYAYSDDGISWTKDAGNPIFSISDGNAYRNSRTYTPTVVDEGEGMLRMFFTAFKSGDADKKIATAYLNYTGPVTINRSGATVMRYRSVDLDLSIENVRNLTVRLFSIAPYVSMSSPASNSIFSNGAINVTYAIGNANYKYAVVSIIQNSNVINSITSGNSSFISRFGVSANEVYNITVTVYDSKGNSATKTATNVTAG